MRKTWQHAKFKILNFTKIRIPPGWGESQEYLQQDGQEQWWKSDRKEVLEGILSRWQTVKYARGKHKWLTTFWMNEKFSFHGCMSQCDANVAVSTSSPKCRKDFQLGLVVWDVLRGVSRDGAPIYNQPRSADHQLSAQKPPALRNKGIVRERMVITLLSRL